MTEMLSRLTGVNPVIKCLAKIGIKLCKAQGINVCVVEGKRSLARQKELYGKGRTVPECRAVMSEQDAKKYSKPKEKKVTWTINSKHIDGLAVDIVPYKGKALSWETNNPDYKKVSAIFKSLGFEWGGDWTATKDYPHYQIVGVKADWKSISKVRYQRNIVHGVQVKLKEKGLYSGKLDGSYNMNFINAIYKFKEIHKLKKNSVITKTFLKKLYL